MQQSYLENCAVPFLEFGGVGEYLHFSHANGYPPQAYRQLLEYFSASHHVIASLHRPLWQPPLEPSSINSWQVFGDDLLQLLAQVGQPAISVGHSMGASAMLLAAAQSPQLFRALILIEPVLVPRHFLWLLRLFSTLAPHKVPLLRKTLQRQDRWSSTTEAFNHFRPKTVFKRISDEMLWDYVNLCTTLHWDGSVALLYSKEWEAHCYTLVHNLWRVLPHLSVPVLAIRGAYSDTLSDQVWQRWQSMSPQHDYLQMPEVGHLLPFEQPRQLASHIADWLAAHNFD